MDEFIFQARKYAAWKAFQEEKPPWCSDFLRDGEGFCFLGFITEVFRRETGQGEWKVAVPRRSNMDEEPRMVKSFWLNDVESILYPPQEVADYFDLTEKQERALAIASDYRHEAGILHDLFCGMEG